MKASNKFWRIFDKTITILMFVSSAIILIDALAITIDVLLRYSLSISYIGIFELTEFSMLWMTFLAAAYIMRSDGHVRVDAIVNLLKPKLAEVVNLIGSFLSIIILIIMIIYSSKLTIHDFKTDFVLSGILQPSKWYIEIIIPIGFLLLLIQLIRNTYEQLTKSKTNINEEQTSSDNTAGGTI